MLIPPHQFAQYKNYRPSRLPKAFADSWVTNHLNWLLNLQVLLADRRGDNREEDIQSLRRCVLKANKRYDDKFSVEEILADLKYAGRAPTTAMIPWKMPDDVLVQSFPGADHVEMPADTLLEIPDRWTPAGPAPIATTSMVICNLTCVIHQTQVPFTMGAIAAPIDLTGDADVVI